MTPFTLLDRSSRRLQRVLARVVVLALIAGACGAVVATPDLVVSASDAHASPVQVEPPTSDTTTTTTTVPPPPTQPSPPPTEPTPPPSPPPTAPASPTPAPPAAPATPPPAPAAIPAPVLPPDLPVIAPPADPNLPPPPPEPPMPDPSPQVAAALARLRLLDLGSTLSAASAKLDMASAIEVQIQAIVDGSIRARDAKRKALTDAAAAAYVQGVVDQASDSPAFSDSAVPVSPESVRMLAGSAIDHTYDEYVAAVVGVHIAQTVLKQVQARLADVQGDFTLAQQDTGGATSTVLGDMSTDMSPTVLGAPALTADEIVGWYKSKGVLGWAGAVDLPTLAALYISEGNAEGVRGDIAFAQSMVETGAFTAPLTRANNFAGIGACDACATGFDFATPQLGVRAQMQLLHAYADKSLSLMDLANPAVGADPDHLSVRGCCTTWNRLTGTWASDPNYGPKIMTVYLSMLDYALASRTAAASAGGLPPAAPPGAAPAPAPPSSP